MYLYLKVVKTPKGDAPEKIRQAWKGIIFKVEPADIFEAQTHQEASVYGEIQPPRKHFRVDSRTALMLLSSNSLEAVGYFVRTWPKSMYYENIYFGWDEVEVLPNDQNIISEYDVRLLNIASEWHWGNGC